MVTAHSAMLLRGGSFGSVSGVVSSGFASGLISLIFSAILGDFAVTSIVSSRGNDGGPLLLRGSSRVGVWLGAGAERFEGLRGLP